MVTFSTNPRTKQYAITKGFSLGERGGVLNINMERTKAVTNLASPYSSYDRNTISLTWSDTFNSSGRPLRFKAGYVYGHGTRYIGNTAFTGTVTVGCSF